MRAEAAFKMTGVKMAAFIISAILASVSTEKPTVRRCCPLGQALNQHMDCVPSNKPWFIEVVLRHLNGTRIMEDVHSEWNVVVQRPHCRLPEAYQHAVAVEDGTLFFRGEHITNGSTFCIDERANIICTDNYLVHLRKCCFHDSVLMLDGHICIGQDKQRITEFMAKAGDWGGFLSEKNPSLDFGFPWCDDGVAEAGFVGENEQIILTDGSLELPRFETILTSREYCLDLAVDNKKTSLPIIFTCANITSPLVSLSAELERGITMKLYPATLLASAFFITVTILASCFFTNMRHQLFWRSQISHLSCLLIGDLQLGIIQLSSDHLSSVVCELMARAVYFCYLAAFFWLNILSYHIWRTFRDLRHCATNTRYKPLRPLVYNLYAWGFPAVISVVAVIADNVAHESFPTALRPKFGELSCWFYGNSELLIYFYSPMGVLLTINFILFVMTVKELHWGPWKHEFLVSNSDRAVSARLGWELVLIMCLVWFLDIVSWVSDSRAEIWLFINAINGLHGVIIFFAVLCQRKVRKALRNLICQRKQSVVVVPYRYSEPSTSCEAFLNQCTLPVNISNVQSCSICTTCTT